MNFQKSVLSKSVIVVTATLASLAPVAAFAVGDMPGGPAVNQINLGPPATQIAAGQIWIHNVLLWVCLAIFVAVFGVMFYSILRHRKSLGHKSAEFHESTTVEIAWTVVPFIIVVGLAAAATGEVIAQKDTSNADITVKATGYQWKWGYDYIKGEGEGIGFLSTLSTPREQIDGRAEKTVTYLAEVDNPLVVPVNRKIRVIVTAADVIHSWYVPAFGVKQDAIPGFVRDTWFKAEITGTFRGFCAELCGKDHAFMPIVVEVLSEEDYSAWVATKKPAAAAAAPTLQPVALTPADDPAKEWAVDDLVARGKDVYATNCVACHQATGAGMPPTFPALAGDKIVLGPPADLIGILLKGKPGTAMASFARLSDTELAAVATYVRNAFGNQADPKAIQPKEFAAAR